MKTISKFALVLGLLIVIPAAAQERDDDEQMTRQGMMQEGIMQGMETCMMMMRTMHSGRMMDGVQGGGMMQGGMMQGGMMQGGMMNMMPQPLHRSMMLAHMLPTMREPLNLDDAQVSRLQGLHEELMSSHADAMERVQALDTELNDLLTQDDAEPAKVEAFLKSIAEARVEMHATMFATAQQMRNALSAEQQAALSRMQPAELHQHMMQNMSMMDMMQMMRRMHGGSMDGMGGMMN